MAWAPRRLHAAVPGPVPHLPAPIRPNGVVKESVSDHSFDEFQTSTPAMSFVVASLGSESMQDMEDCSLPISPRARTER